MIQTNKQYFDQPKRFPVPPRKRLWEKPFPEYNPPYYVSQKVLKNNEWADPEDIQKIKIKELKSFEGKIKLNKDKVPLNPRGRTGLQGRGLLGKWGPNFAADSIITKENIKTGKLQILLIKRQDTNKWALPGGMVKNNEKFLKTANRELKEETGLDIKNKNHKIKQYIIYQGYTNDPRNTDNAWIETTVIHTHLPKNFPKQHLKANDDAIDVQWFTLSPKLLNKLYADHGHFIKLALKNFKNTSQFKKIKNKEINKQISEILSYST